MTTKYHVNLSKENRQELESLIRSGESSLMCSLPTITAIRKKFIEGGLENALYDKSRPGAVPKITGEIEAQLTLLACSAPPEGRLRWTLQLLADQLVELKLVEALAMWQ